MLAGGRVTGAADLVHRTEPCTGTWRREAGRVWRCGGCRAIAPASAEVDPLVGLELASGWLLRVLTAEGRALLGDPP